MLEVGRIGIKERIQFKIINWGSGHGDEYLCIVWEVMAWM